MLNNFGGGEGAVWFNSSISPGFLYSKYMAVFPKNLTSPVRDVIQSYPKNVQIFALDLRDLIYETAANDVRIGTLTETLKWGEPSYLTEKTKSGTTLRFDWKTSGKFGVFVNCRTTLIRSFRDLFSDDLDFEGTRAIWLNPDQPLPRDVMGICVGKALTYHLDKR